MRGFPLREQAAIDGWLDYVGRATVRGVMYDLGSFPGVVAGEGRVTGELYEMTDPVRLLARTDSIEGYRAADIPCSHYVRVAVRAERPPASAVQTWLYLYNRELREAGRIVTGDYAGYIRRRYLFPHGRPHDPGRSG